MAKVDGNKPAFPGYAAEDHDGGTVQVWADGMNLRTWLAGQAMTGIMANEEKVRVAIEVAVEHRCEQASVIARHALFLADKLIEELNKSK